QTGAPQPGAPQPGAAQPGAAQPGPLQPGAPQLSPGGPTMPVGPAAGPGTKESLGPGTKELLGPGTKELLGPGTKEPLGGGRPVGGAGSGAAVVVGVGGCRQVYGTSGCDGAAPVADGMERELPFVGVVGKDWAVGRLPAGPEEVESGLRRLNNPVGSTSV